MSNSPVVGYVPYFARDGEPASGWWIKGYVPTTTTPLTMYTDSTTGTPLVKAEINAQGLPATSGGSIFAPHFAAAHDLWLFPTEAEADDDDTTNAIKIVSNGALVASTGTIASLGQNSLTFRNRVYNGAFNVNQRSVSGTVSLSAGEYGHDRWRGGSGGCTYTFADQTEDRAILTISAGTLEQEIEGTNLQTGTYTLSWSGTAQCSVDGGASADSSIAVDVTGGTNVVLSFGTGTLSNVQLEPGTTESTFEHRPKQTEEMLCYRYFWRIFWSASGVIPVANQRCYQSVSGTTYFPSIYMPVEMRTDPTVTFSEARALNFSDGTFLSGETYGTFYTNTQSFSIRVDDTGLAVGDDIIFGLNVNGYIDVDAEIAP